MFLPLLLAAALPSVVGDFDRDGRPDRAAVERAGASHQLVVRHGSGAVTMVEDAIDDPASFYVALAAPGQVATACADPRTSDKACPGESIPMGDTLMFGGKEASGAVALWNGTGFEVVWIAD